MRGESSLCALGFEMVCEFCTKVLPSTVASKVLDLHSMLGISLCVKFKQYFLFPHRFCRNPQELTGMLEFQRIPVESTGINFASQYFTINDIIQAIGTLGNYLYKGLALLYVFKVFLLFIHIYYYFTLNLLNTYIKLNTFPPKEGGRRRLNIPQTRGGNGGKEGITPNAGDLTKIGWRAKCTPPHQ